MKKIIIIFSFIILTTFIMMGILAHPWTLSLKHENEESLGLKKVLTTSDEPVESVPQFISDVSEELISVVDHLLPKKSVDDTAQSDMPAKVIIVNNDQEDNEGSPITINTIVDSLSLLEIHNNIARTKESWNLYKILSLHRETIHRLSEAEKDSTNSIKKKGFVR